MFEGLIDKAVDFSGVAFRNIASIVISEDLLDDLATDTAERSFGEALVSEQKETEDFTSPIITRPFIYGAALSDTVFPTRFSNGTQFGVWYGSLDLLTTIYETIYHFRKRLSDMLIPITEDVLSERRLFQVDVNGILVDLRGKYRKFPKLLHTEDYAFTTAVGAYLHDRGQNGLLIESARYMKGTNIAALTPDILSNARHHSYMIYRLNTRSSTVRIEKTRGRIWKVLNV